MINGCFENPQVEKWQIFENGVEGWSGEGIEIGKGKFYNNRWPKPNKDQVAEMDGKQNVEMSQTVALKQGQYSLSLKCAARKGQDLGTSQLEILWNG